ncbi:MAG: hypothetical protein RL722_915 [Pseudomonadota bacterium]|jgi:hypothetical protein
MTTATTTARDVLMLDLLPGSAAHMLRGGDVLTAWCAPVAERGSRATATVAVETDWEWLELGTGDATGLEVIEHQVPVELLAALFHTNAPQRGALAGLRA